MTIFLGLDLSKANTGWCYLDPHNHSTARVGSIKALGDWETATADFSRKLMTVINSEGKPDFCVIETPLRSVMQHKKKGTNMMPELDSFGMTINPKTSLILNQIAGATVGVLTGYSIPFETVAPSTWRKGFYRTGSKLPPGQNWKTMAVKQCKLIGIEVRNQDQAESVGVAFAGPNCERFKKIKYDQTKKVGA